jgi:hypothetical protein
LTQQTLSVNLGLGRFNAGNPSQSAHQQVGLEGILLSLLQSNLQSVFRLAAPAIRVSRNDIL